MIALTPGQAGDGPQAEPLLEAVLVTATDGDSKDDSRLKEARRLKETPCISAVRGDKGYDSDALIAYIEALKAKPVIPSKKNRLTPRASDPELYKDRNKIERFIGRIKHYRRIATRYEKTAHNYLALLHLVGAMVWLL